MAANHFVRVCSKCSTVKKSITLMSFCALFTITVWHLVLVYGDPACDLPIYSSPCGCLWH